MYKYFIFTIVFLSCSSKVEYDFSRVKVAPNEFYEHLNPEMYMGNKLGKDIFYIESIHHKDVILVASVVYGAGIEGGVTCLWGKTKGVNHFGMWYALSTNFFSKHFPKHNSLKSIDCCAKTLKAYTKAYYNSDN